MRADERSERRLPAVDGQFGRRGGGQGRTNAAGFAATTIVPALLHDGTPFRLARITLPKELGNQYTQPDSHEENRAGRNG
jgi:hypothetical protein